MRVGKALRRLVVVPIFVLLGNFTGEPLGELRLPQGYADAIVEITNRSYRTENEEFYCLIGHQVGRAVVVTAMMRPRQMAGITKFSNGIVRHWVSSDSCPPNTVADLHTHPMMGAWEASEIDLENWKRHPYSLFVIAYPRLWLSGVNMTVYERFGGKIKPRVARLTVIY